MIVPGTWYHTACDFFVVVILGCVSSSTKHDPTRSPTAVRLLQSRFEEGGFDARSAVPEKNKRSTKKPVPGSIFRVIRCLVCFEV